MGQPLFCICIRGVGCIDFAAIRGSPFSFRSSLATFIILVERRSDGRARFVISYNSLVAKQPLRIVPLKARSLTSYTRPRLFGFVNIGKIQMHVDDLSPIISPRNVYCWILQLLLFTMRFTVPVKSIASQKIQKT